MAIYYGGPQVQNTFTKSKTRSLNPKHDYKIQNTFTKSKTCLQNQKHVHKIKNTFTKSKTRLQNQKHVYKFQNTFTKSKTCLQNQKHVYKIQNTFTKSKIQNFHERLFQKEASDWMINLTSHNAQLACSYAAIWRTPEVTVLDP